MTIKCIILCWQMHIYEVRLKWCFPYIDAGVSLLKFLSNSIPAVFCSIYVQIVRWLIWSYDVVLWFNYLTIPRFWAYHCIEYWISIICILLNECALALEFLIFLKFDCCVRFGKNLCLELWFILFRLKGRSLYALEYT